jgi:hypothetical protein
MRKGFALVAALIAVILIGALIVGAFVATSEETRISGNVKGTARALVAAETVLEGNLTGWAALEIDSLAIAQQAARSDTLDGETVRTTLVRLDSSVYWLVAEAADATASASGGAPRRRIALLARRVSDSTGKVSLLRLEDRAWSELF